MLTFLGWALAVVVVLFAAGFLHHRFKMKHDPYYRYQVGQSIQDAAAERNAAELRALLRK